MSTAAAVRRPPWLAALVLALVVHLAAAAWWSWQAPGADGGGGGGGGDGGAGGSGFGLAGDLSAGRDATVPPGSVLQPTRSSAVVPRVARPAKPLRQVASDVAEPAAAVAPPPVTAGAANASPVEHASADLRPQPAAPAVRAKTTPPPATVTGQDPPPEPEAAAPSRSTLAAPRRRPTEVVVPPAAPRQGARPTAAASDPGDGAGRAGRGSGTDGGGRGGGSGRGDGAGIADGPGADALAAYAAAVQRALARHKRYPRSAQVQGQQGAGRVALVIARDGRLERVEVTASTSHRVLDRELAAMARRAAPFARFPAALDRARVHLELPVGFALD
ncbi:MAG: TonB family protein [Alphaproteobacteria bacterium]